jgi:ribokinase
VLVVGGISTDYIARGAELPAAGEAREGELFVERSGGKGANQAVIASRLGVTVALIGAIGNDERGRLLTAHLRDERVDTSHIATRATYATGVAVVHVDRDGHKQSVAVLGANGSLTAAEVADACAAVGQARVVLAQCEVPLPCVETALAWGRRVGAHTVLDPAPARPLPDALLRLANVIKPNANEAEALTGIVVKDRRSARRAAEELMSRGAGAVIVEAGDEGTLVRTSDEERCFARLPVLVMDTTGGGDTFAGAFAAFLVKGCSLFEAAKLANAATAMEVTRPGAQTPRLTEQQVRQALRQHERE